MSVNLRHFDANEVIISPEGAWAIYRFFWPDFDVPKATITIEDRAFTQALLLEALDASYKMGFVNALYDAFFGKVPGSFIDIKDMVKDFVKNAVKLWFRHAIWKESDPEIYVSVRNTLANNFKPVLDSRLNGLPMDY